MLQDLFEKNLNKQKYIKKRFQEENTKKPFKNF